MSYLPDSCAISNPTPAREDEPSLRDQVCDALLEAGYSRLFARTLDEDTCIVALHLGPALSERTASVAGLLMAAHYDVICVEDGVLAVGWPGSLGTDAEVADPYAIVAEGVAVEVAA